jgi:hypothetical protein
MDIVPACVLSAALALLAPLALSPLGAAPSPARRPSEIKADYSAVVSRLDQTCDWQSCHDREVRHAWALAGDWLAAYLDGHATASAADLVASLADLDPHSAPGKPADEVRALHGQALDLGTGDFAVAMQYGETGTFFVIGRSKEGRSRVRWSIDTYAGSAAARSELRCWKVDADCGPLYGTIEPLPPTDRELPRFYLNAGFAGNGMTIGAQTSVWVWTGDAARPLAVLEYSEMLGDDRTIEFDGTHLTIPVKEETEGFSTSGSSEDPKGTWTLEITGAGVRDLGNRWDDPELEGFDRLFAALAKGRDTSDLADPEVARQLKLHVEEFSGMLMDWSVHRGPATTLRVDVEGEKMSFALTRRKGFPYATAVTFEEP